MNEFMKLLLSLSISGTLLLLLVFLSRQLYKTKLSRTWQYYIWLVAVLRFLLPFTPDTTIVGSLFAVGNKMGSFENVENTHPLAIAPMDIIIIESENTTAAASFSISISNCLFFLWLVFVLFFLFRKIAAYRKFIRHIRLYNVEVLDAEYIKLLADCGEKLNIRKRVKLCCNTGIASPIMVGFIHPCIILPEGQVKEEELYYIFTHELIHYKRRDLFYKWLIQLVICIHWFNPFIYLLEKEINRACELACDEAMISSLDDNGRREYGDTLLSYLRKNNSKKNNFVSVTLTEGAEQVKERLGAIMDFHRKSTGIKVVTLVLTIAFCVCFVAVGAYAADDIVPGGAVLDKTAWSGATLDGTVPSGTTLDKAALEETVTDGVILDKAALEETVPDGTLSDRTAMNDIASYESSPDSTLLHWYGTSSDVSKDIPEGATGYIIIKIINEDGSVGYIGWGIKHKEDVHQNLEMSGSMPTQTIQPLKCEGISEDGKVKVLIESRMTVNEEGNSVEHSTYVYIPENAEVVSYVPMIEDSYFCGQ